MTTRDVIKQNERSSWGKVFQANFKDSLNLKRTLFHFRPVGNANRTNRCNSSKNGNKSSKGNTSNIGNRTMLNIM